MHVADPVVVAPHEVHRVAAPVGVMADVEAERHPVGVGLLEECLYLVFVLDVRLCVRMEHELEPKPFPERIREIVDGVDQKLPRVRVQFLWGRRLTRRLVCLRTVDQDQEPGSQCGEQLPGAVDLPVDFRSERRVVQVFHGKRAA